MYKCMELNGCSAWQGKWLRATRFLVPLPVPALSPSHPSDPAGGGGSDRDLTAACLSMDCLAAGHTLACERHQQYLSGLLYMCKSPTQHGRMHRFCLLQQHTMSSIASLWHAVDAVRRVRKLIAVKCCAGEPSKLQVLQVLLRAVAEPTLAA